MGGGSERLTIYASLRFSLGEARETRGWYYRSRHALPPELLEHRYKVVDHLISLLTSTIGHK